MLSCDITKKRQYEKIDFYCSSKNVLVAITNMSIIPCFEIACLHYSRIHQQKGVRIISSFQNQIQVKQQSNIGTLD